VANLHRRPESGRKRIRKNNQPRKREWRRINKDKHAAHRALERAVRNGTIVKPDLCAYCGAKCNPDGHHEDYTRRFDVIWLCHVCHLKLHAGRLSLASSPAQDRRRSE
jgi:hypothetical protein